MEYKDFINQIKKVSGSRNHKVKNSYGVRDYFSYYRKVKPSDKKYVLSDVEYYKIIREINNIFCEELIKSGTVDLPKNMGSIIGVQYDSIVKYNGDKLFVNRPIDFNKTLQLWYEDEECRNNKTLVRVTDRVLYNLRWDRKKSQLVNQSFFIFKFNRELKHTIRLLAKEGKYETYYK